MWFEIHFRFEGKWVNINGQCVCKHFLTIRSACFYRVDCYQVCPWPISSNYGTFNAISEEQDSTWVPITPQCAAMSPFKRFIDWILFTIVSGRFEPSASSSSFCIDGNTMYWSNGCVLQWQWGAPPSKAKEIWFCLWSKIDKHSSNIIKRINPPYQLHLSSSQLLQPLSLSSSLVIWIFSHGL